MEWNSLQVGLPIPSGLFLSFSESASGSRWLLKAILEVLTGSAGISNTQDEKKPKLQSELSSLSSKIALKTENGVNLAA